MLFQKAAFVIPFLENIGNNSISFLTIPFTILIYIAVLALLFYCVIKVDTILRAFHVHRLFSDDTTLNLPKEPKADWISVAIVILGFYILIPSLVDVLVQSVRIIQNKLNSSGLDYIMMQQVTDPGRLTENIIEFLAGILLITQSKYLGRYIYRKVISEDTAPQSKKKP